MVDKVHMSALRDILEEELNNVALKVGFNLSVTGWTLHNNTATLSLTCSPYNENKEIITEEGECFKQMAARIGLKPEYLHQEILIRGRVLVVTGAVYGRWKYPVNAKRKGDWRLLKLAPSQVIDGLQAMEAWRNRTKKSPTQY